MSGSHWVNAHGLHDDEQYTTVRDMALLAVAIRREFPQNVDYFAIEGLAAGKVKLPNHNTLIGRFDGADGMKTGFTCPAGFNLVASATRKGRTIIAVLVGEPSVSERAAKAAQLLEDGFKRNQSFASSLATLPVDGNMLVEATNMRPVICTEDARKERAENRDEDGRMIIRSPYIRDLDRERRLVAVGLGGATGPKSPAAAVEYANVPIPTPRPDYKPATQTAVQ